MKTINKIFIFTIIVLLALLIFVYIKFAYPIMMEDVNVSKRMACASNLQTLSIGIKKQMAEQGMIEDANWCDILQKNIVSLEISILYVLELAKKVGML